MRHIAALVLALAGCGERQPTPAETETEPGTQAQQAPTEEQAEAPEWPAEGAPLTMIDVTVPQDFETRQIYIDAGHGLPGNPGAIGVFCHEEQNFTLLAARELRDRLEQTGAFEVRISRQDNNGPSYNQRLREANGWADALVSLHFDARLADEADTWSPTEGQSCRINEEEHGFSVLYSDEDDEPLRSHRRKLATDLARRLVHAGFPPYLGRDYEGRYEGDPEQSGAYVDRHEPSKRILMLRGPEVPSVIIETHQALDREEVLRWREERTHDAFGAAVAQGLVDFFLAPSPGS